MIANESEVLKYFTSALKNKVDAVLLLDIWFLSVSNKTSPNMVNFGKFNQLFLIKHKIKPQCVTWLTNNDWLTEIIIEKMFWSLLYSQVLSIFVCNMHQMSSKHTLGVIVKYQIFLMYGNNSILCFSITLEGDIFAACRLILCVHCDVKMYMPCTLWIMKLVGKSSQGLYDLFKSTLAISKTSKLVTYGGKCLQRTPNEVLIMFNHVAYLIVVLIWNSDWTEYANV